MRPRKFRLGLMVISTALVLVGGSAVGYAVAGKRPEHAKPRVQTIQMGTVKSPEKGAKAHRKTLRVRRKHTEPFSAYGVTWLSDAGTVKVTGRVRQDGRWLPWQELDVEESGKPGGRSGASLAWTGPSDGVEVAVRTVSGPNPRQVEVALIDPGESPVDAAAAELHHPKTGQAPAPEIYRRADWGADESKMTWDPEYADSVVAVVLHHTATHSAYDYTPGEVPQIIRSIYHYQAVELGWGDIGYNVVVDRFGRLWEGRAGGLERPVIGGHAGGFNTGTAGIAMIGHHSETPVPDVVIDSAAHYAAWKFAPYRVDPRGTTEITGGPSSRYPERVTITVPRIFPHRETSRTECPGAYGMDALQPIRDRAYGFARDLYGYRESTGPRPSPTGQDTGQTRPAAG